LSSWSSDNSSNYDSSNYSNEQGLFNNTIPKTKENTISYIIMGLFLIIIFFMICEGIYYLIFYPIILKIKEKKELKEYMLKENKKIMEIPPNENILKKIINNYDRKKFIEERFKDFVTIQNDLMNFNYKELREKLTDELYNQYKMEMQILETKKEKIIMSDFKLESGYINYVEENELVVVYLRMIVSFNNYIEKNSKFIKRRKKKKVKYDYTLEYLMDPNSIDICPNCGNKLNENLNQICPYCRSKITRLGKKWLLNKKKIIKQY